MLRVSLLQLDLIWENPKENIQKINSLLPKKDTTDVVILPEMFTTGFTMHPKKCGHQNDAEVIHMMHTWAEQSNALVIGSAAVKTTNSDKYFNRLFAVTPSGKTHHYDKRHLFQMANEHLHYAPGQKKCIVSWRGYRLEMFICYDLRFPVWCRNTENVDAQIFVANWPAARMDPWISLLKARAIENLCYTIGVNRVGKDGNGIEHNGHSGIFDFKGQNIASIVNEEKVITLTISQKDLTEFKAKFPAHTDADDFILTPNN